MPHFEIHVSDVTKAKEFYAGLFGWSFIKMEGDEAEAIDYHLAEGEEIGFDKGLTLGLLKRMGDAAPNGSAIRGGTMTFEVADCDNRYAWALDNGGAEALPPTDFEGIGRCAYVEDGFGNVVGMITPAQEEN